MAHPKIISYKVAITAKKSCAPSKSQHDTDFPPDSQVAANNYFHSMATFYKCQSFSKPEQTVKQAEGENYVITLTSVLENLEASEKSSD